VTGSARGLCAGATFLLGFGAALWLTGAAVGELRGPRAGLMRELNLLRDAARVSALRADRHLGGIAQQQAKDLARGSAVAGARNALELERSARRRGWRGSAPLRELRLRAPDAGAALRTAAASEPPPPFLDPGVTQVGVGLAPIPDGGFIAVILVAP
jgi:hypothetical protein